MPKLCSFIRWCTALRKCSSFTGAAGLLLQHVYPPTPDAPAIVTWSPACSLPFKTSCVIRSDVDEEHALESLEVGDVTVWVERGPRAALAAVIRGTPPREVRSKLQEFIERIHLEHVSALENFDGDTLPFEATRPLLESCLHTELREPDKKKRSWPAWVATIVVLGLLGYWFASSMYRRSHWNEYIALLTSEPGVVVLEDTRGWSGYQVSGLLDPLARDPKRHLQAVDIDPNRVVHDWNPYYSTDPAIVEARVHKLLAPPGTRVNRTRARHTSR